MFHEAQLAEKIMALVQEAAKPRPQPKVPSYQSLVDADFICRKLDVSSRTLRRYITAELFPEPTHFKTEGRGRPEYRWKRAVALEAIKRLIENPVRANCARIVERPTQPKPRVETREPNAADVLLTAAEVCDRLNVSRAWLASKVGRAVVGDGIKLGGARRYKSSVIAKIIAGA